MQKTNLCSVAVVLALVVGMCLCCGFGGGPDCKGSASGNAVLDRRNAPPTLKRTCHAHCSNFVIGASDTPICECLGSSNAVVTHHFQSPVTGRCLKAEELRFLPHDVRVPLFEAALNACQSAGCKCTRVSTKDIRRDTSQDNTLLYE